MKELPKTEIEKQTEATNGIDYLPINDCYLMHLFTPVTDVRAFFGEYSRMPIH